MKTKLNLVLSVGQSNSYGQGGNGTEAPTVVPGTGFDIGYDGAKSGNAGYQNDNMEPVPLYGTDGVGERVSGLRAAFCNEWYRLTGEKSLFINAANPGISINEWQSSRPTYENAKREVLRVEELLAASDRWAPQRKIFYFNHGAANIGDAGYKTKLEHTFDLLRDELGFQFGGVWAFFASHVPHTSYIRAVQNQVINARTERFAGASRGKSRPMRPTFSNRGWADIIVAAEIMEDIQLDGTLLCDDNLHATQKGHNLAGERLARSMAEHFVLGGGLPERMSAQPKGKPFVDLADVHSVHVVHAETPAGVQLGPSDFVIDFSGRLDEGQSKASLLSGGSFGIDINVNAGIWGIDVLSPESRTLSAGIDADALFHGHHHWRIDYNKRTNLMYLYRDGILISKEVWGNDINVRTVGGAGLRLSRVRIWV